MDNYILPEDYLNDIFQLDIIDNKYKEDNFSTYTFNGNNVPRVSDIIKKSINREYLVQWAAAVGYKKMTQIRNEATVIGTAVHNMIEHFLLYNEDLDVKTQDVSPFLYDKVLKAYNNFKNWKTLLELKGYKIEEVVCVERKIVTPLYGGTIDCILKINGAYYLVDFKTSKEISFEYIIQTCSYMWAVNNGYAPDLPHIDGIGIIRIDKSLNRFNDLFLNYHIPEQKVIIDNYYKGFSALLNSFYNIINMELYFKKYNSEYDIEKVIFGGK